jgi:CBS domain-containing protein
MNLLAPVSDIMIKDVITVKPDNSLDSVREIFEKHNIHHIPVVDGETLVGMISKSDYLFFSKDFGSNFYDKYIEEIRRKNYDVKEVMTTKLARLESDDRINVALEVFRVNRFHALPVVENDKLVGIVTTFDIIDYLAKDQGAEMSYKK